MPPAPQRSRPGEKSSAKPKAAIISIGKFDFDWRQRDQSGRDIYRCSVGSVRVSGAAAELQFNWIELNAHKIKINVHVALLFVQGGVGGVGVGVGGPFWPDLSDPIGAERKSGRKGRHFRAQLYFVERRR